MAYMLSGMTHLPTTALVAEVRAEMGRRGVTATTLAAASGISQPALSRKLRGSRDFSLAEILRVCDALDVRLADLAQRAEGVAA